MCRRHRGDARGHKAAAAMRALRPKRAAQRALFGLFAEVRPSDAFFQVLERAEILDDVAAGVVEEDLAFLIATHGDQPVELVSVLEQVVDGLRNPSARYDGDLWLKSLLLLCH